MHDEFELFKGTTFSDLMKEEEKNRLLQTAQEELDAIHKEQDEINLGDTK